MEEQMSLMVPTKGEVNSSQSSYKAIQHVMYNGKKWWYPWEVRDALIEQFDIHVSPSTVERYMRKPYLEAMKMQPAKASKSRAWTYSHPERFTQD